MKLSWLGSESWLVTELTSSATYKLLQSLYFISRSLSPNYKLHQLLLLFSCCVWAFCNPMDCSLPGFSVYRISQTRILELVVILLQGSSWHRDWTCISCRGSLSMRHQGRTMSTRFVSLPHLTNENLYYVQWNEIADKKKKLFSLACSHYFVHIYSKIIHCSFKIQIYGEVLYFIWQSIH